MIQKLIFGILVAICIVGLIGIPMGDPKFIVNAVILESAFVVLGVISLLRLRQILIPNIIISIIVIIGNTASPKHLEIMSTLTPLENSLVLLIGGYILQGLLLTSSSIAFAKRKQFEKNIQK